MRKINKNTIKTHKLMFLSALTTRKVGEAYTQYNKTAEKFKLLPFNRGKTKRNPRRP